MGSPSGTVTFLFTDVEDSSAFWDRHPTIMRSALEQHDGLLRAAIEARDGYVFTTAGDSFAAAFARADDAAAAALQIQASISAAEWPAETPLRVRIGLHTGEAHERDGDYFGPAVNRAARIEAAGHGGQVLVSDATATVLRGSTATTWDLTDLGTHPLKGLSLPERIHQLDAGPEPTTFDPLRVARTGASNLRGGPPSMVGRDEDLAGVLHALGQQPLVTLAGIGGVGKTTLATAVAHEAAEAHDEVWFVELAPVAPGTVTSATASILGMTGVPDDPGHLASALARRGNVLVVLDNCEHVIDEAATLAECLAREPGVRCLATSRLELEVATEHVYRLAPLDVTDPAAALFERVARQRNPGFVLDSANRSAVEEICARVDGIPLAIELAAAKARSLEPSAILARLDSVLSSPARRPRGQSRHATMSAAIDWSIDLLDEDLAQALGVLTVFNGTFDLDAGEHVLGAVLGVDGSSVLDELVAHSLVETLSTVAGTRYRLLGPVRQRASDTLLSEPTPARDAHADHFLDRQESAYELLGSTSSKPIRDLLAFDLDNLGSVHRWTFDSGRIDDNFRLFRALSLAGSDTSAPADWAVEAVTAHPDHPDRMPALRVALFDQTIRRGISGVDRDLLNDARELDAVGPHRAVILSVQGFFSRMTESDERTLRIYAQLAEVADEDPLAHYLLYFNGTASAAAITGDVETARSQYAGGLAWARRIGAEFFVGGILEVWALMELNAGQLARCVELAEEAEAVAGGIGGDEFVRARAVEHQVRAALRGAAVARSLEALLTDVLESAVVAGSALRASLALATGIELFQRHRLDDLAELASAVAPALAASSPTGDVPEARREAAARRMVEEGLDPLDIAVMAIQALAALDA